MNRSLQSGAVMVVSLVMLLLITAIAASLLTSSTFQTKMSANAQQRETVFRVAESATEQVFPLDDTKTTNAVNAGTAGVGIAVSTSQDNMATPTAHLSDLEAGAATKGSRPYIFSGGSLTKSLYTAHPYEVRGTASTSDSRIGTQVVVGAIQIQPNPNGGSADN